VHLKILAAFFSQQKAAQCKKRDRIENSFIMVCRLFLKPWATTSELHGTGVLEQSVTQPVCLPSTSAFHSRIKTPSFWTRRLMGAGLNWSPC